MSRLGLQGQLDMVERVSHICSQTSKPLYILLGSRKSFNKRTGYSRNPELSWNEQPDSLAKEARSSFHIYICIYGNTSIDMYIYTCTYMYMAASIKNKKINIYIYICKCVCAFKLRRGATVQQSHKSTTFGRRPRQ